jgi:hypothetical protein
MRQLIFGLCLIALTAVSCNQEVDPPSQLPTKVETSSTTTEVLATEQEVQFSTLNSIYQFSGKISQGWMVEYIPEIESINIYDPQKSGTTNLDKSLIFIRYFNANSFLTLNSVEILSRSNDDINGHPAVRYEIKKKAGVANFAKQPAWRNGQHKLIDIRYSSSNPSSFFVIAYSPELPTETFEKFIASLEFHNDATSLRQPLDRAEERITKKPFGLYVSPTNSPVNPERFTGFHNAVDFEIFPDEENSIVPVSAICGGPLLTKQIANGYGGVVTQSCRIDQQPVTVIYGHLAIDSVTAQIGKYLSPGSFVGNLGAAYSADTDNGRKHLHLGIKKGQGSDIRGYVPQASELNNWLDFTDLLK